MELVLVGCNQEEAQKLTELLPQTSGKLYRYLVRILDETKNASKTEHALFYLERDPDLLAFCRKHQKEYPALADIGDSLEWHT
jgi:hypothetical protein